MKSGALVLAVCVVDVFSAENDIKMNWGKIEDMSTDFSMRGENMPLHRNRFDIQVDGHLQLNVMAEQFKITAVPTVAVSAPPPKGWGHHGRNYREPLIPQFIKDSGKSGQVEMMFDGPSGIVAIRTSGSMVDRQEGPLDGMAVSDSVCFTMKVPPGLIPPSAQFAPMLKGGEQQAEHMANLFPHTVDGDVATYSHTTGLPEPNGPNWPYSEIQLKMHTDGTPISFNAQERCDEPCVPYVDPRMFHDSITFSNWTRGTGDIQSFDCKDATELMAKPAAMAYMALFQVMTDTLAQNRGTEWLAAGLPDFSLLLAEESTSGAGTSGSSLLAVSIASALSGGAFVLMLVKVMSGRKTLREQPLLSHC